jgi:hypothetical protein
MQIFIDESGSFSWSTPAISLMVALVVPDGAMDALEARFLTWKSSVIGKSTRELKGSELDSDQLQVFVRMVLPESERTPLLSVVGADTARTEENHVAMARDQLAAQYAHTARLLLEYDPPNNSMAQNYTEVSGWTKKRSAVNFLWIATAERTIAESLQLMVCAFLEQQYDQEFKEIEIAVDRSFIKEPGPINFWIEYVRLARLNRTTGGSPFLVPRDWKVRNHPFNRKYRKDDGITDFTDLLRNHMNFVDSRHSIGIQIADICAQICRRYHCGNAALTAYSFIENRIVGRDGATLLLLHFDKTSIFEDKPEDHVRLRTTKELKRRLQALHGEKAE